MATNYAEATYTEVIDLQTIADKVSIIGIHTPRGNSPYNRLKGFFTQFTKFKYNGIKSLVMVPAAQLPIDPLGLTGVVGTTDLMDPRDALNPILFHGAHGEHLTKVLDQIYTKVSVPDGTGAVTEISSTDNVQVSDSADKFDNDMTVSGLVDLQNYYSKLTDRTWRKFGIQSGVKLNHLRPLVNKVVRNTPLLPAMSNTASYTDSQIGMIRSEDTSNPGFLRSAEANTYSASAVSSAWGEAGGSAYVPTDNSLYQTGFDNQMFTSGKAPLGWLPTTMNSNVGNNARVTILPKIFMGLLVLPPAYNVEQYFRMVITHSFSFKGFTSSLGLMDEGVTAPTGTTGIPYTNWIDYGDTLDSVNAKSAVLSDGVM